jgi:hypothetical protein
MAAAIAVPELRWEFCGRDEDSDWDEEPKLLDGVDYNYYLTRRLHERSNTPLPDWREAASDVAIPRDAVYAVREHITLRQSRRLSEKHRSASTVLLPLVETKTADEGIEEDDVEGAPVPTVPLLRPRGVAPRS